MQAHENPWEKPMKKPGSRKSRAGFSQRESEPIT